MDYTGNSHKGRGQREPGEVPPPKNLEKVVSGDVKIQKRGIGRKIRDLFVEADLRSVIRYVASDVLIPAARNMIVDGAAKGVDRLVYGESTMRRRGYGGGGPRVTYNNPINRGYRDASSRMAPAVTSGPRSRHARDDFILSTREEAETVLERLNDIIDNYEVVSVGDLNELVGLPSSHVDNKWGWVFLGDVQIRQIREGYLIDLPPAEPIQ